MDASAHRRVWVEIDLATLRENFGKIRAAVTPCSVIAVLKANAYGLGVEPIAQALAEAGLTQENCRLAHILDADILVQRSYIGIFIIHELEAGDAGREDEHEQ